MPVMACRMDDKPGYKYGENGHCYTYTADDERSRKAAKRKAMLQGAAIEASKQRAGHGSGKVEEFDNSLNDFVDRVRAAFDRQFSRRDDAMMGPGEYTWATDIFSDHVIARQGERYFRVGMDVTDEAVVFDTRDDWEEVRLSYVAEMLQLEPRRDVLVVYEIKGNYPDVPFAKGVDVKALTEGDDDPVFVTLPIGKANVRSGNKRFYDEAFLAELERQVNANKPVGLFGHLSQAQRATEFPAEAVHWLGALRVGELLWGKGYVPAGEARNRFKRYRSTNKKIATSIDAVIEGEWDDKVGGYRMKADTLHLAQIDIAPADRAGIADLAAVPHLTTEMTAGAAWSATGDMESNQENVMDKLQVINEMTAEDARLLPDAVRQAVLAGVTPPPEVALVQELRQALGVDDKADVTKLVTELQAQQEAARQDAVKRRISELVNEGVKVESVRGLVTELVNARNPQSAEEAATAYAQVMEMQSVKDTLASTVQRVMGPPQRTPIAAQTNGKGGGFFIYPAEESA